MRHKLTALFLILFSVSLFAKNTVNTTTYDAQLTNASLLEGVLSENKGLSLSATHMAGTMKTEQAVIPLMKILRTSDDEAARISAAQALVKIGDSRGVFAVKKAAEFDESKRVRNLCAKFYFQSLIDG